MILNEIITIFSTDFVRSLFSLYYINMSPLCPSLERNYPVLLDKDDSYNFTAKVWQDKNICLSNPTKNDKEVNTG